MILANYARDLIYSTFLAMNNTTLAIFAIVAVLGLTAATFVVIPNIPAANADRNDRSLGNCNFNKVPQKCRSFP